MLGVSLANVVVRGPGSTGSQPHRLDTQVFGMAYVAQHLVDVGPGDFKADSSFRHHVPQVSCPRANPVAIEYLREEYRLVWCLTNTLMKLRGHFGCRQGVLRLRFATLRTCRGDLRSPPSGGYHARKSNAADGQKDPQIRKRICETPH